MTRFLLPVLLVIASCGSAVSVDGAANAPMTITPAIESLAPDTLPPNLRIAVLPYMVPSSKHQDLPNFQILNGSGDKERDHFLATSRVRSLYQKTKFGFLAALIKQAEVREVGMDVAADHLAVQAGDIFNSDSTPKFGRFEGYDAVLLLYFDCALVDFQGGEQPQTIEVDFYYKIIGLETNTLLAAQAGQLRAVAGS